MAGLHGVAGLQRAAGVMFVGTLDMMVGHVLNVTCSKLSPNNERVICTRILVSLPAMRVSSVEFKVATYLHPATR